MKRKRRFPALTLAPLGIEPTKLYLTVVIKLLAKYTWWPSKSRLALQVVGKDGPFGIAGKVSKEAKIIPKVFHQFRRVDIA